MLENFQISKRGCVIFLIITCVVLFGLLGLTLFGLYIKQQEKSKIIEKSKNVVSVQESYDYKTFPQGYIDSLDKIKGDLSSTYYKKLTQDKTALFKRSANLKKIKSVVKTEPKELVSIKKKESKYTVILTVKTSTDMVFYGGEKVSNEVQKNIVVSWEKEGKDYKATSVTYEK